MAYICEEETLRQAGHRMRQLGVAALPVCAQDGSLRGIITGDMVVKSIATGGDPKTVTVGEISCDAPASSRAARREAPRPDPAGYAAGYGTGLRIGELADAVRAAADAASRLRATMTRPRMPTWR